MGASSSTSAKPHLQKSVELTADDEDIVRVMMPVYYNSTELTEEQIKLIKGQWDMILKNTAPGYLQEKRENEGDDTKLFYSSSVEFFYHEFYDRLFDIHPMAKDLFSDAKSQGRFLVKMISLSLSESQGRDRYVKTLKKLAEIHNERGVKAIEYGVVGEVLFWAVRRCLGPECYSFESHSAWVGAYSRMLQIMVPLALAYEMKDNSAQERRFFGETIGLSSAEENVLTAIQMGPKDNNSLGNSSMSSSHIGDSSRVTSIGDDGGMYGEPGSARLLGM
mmetsp:Transcript_7988/g.13277  ORF Transcript_7988/g.13277 Transcript_7988/m.13277 type:complete len:277 (-) Transcript_7988:1668-2498(-)|eukprot:CAMPEP_0174960506 /NCGR_PEP_ID=MMETSP0004_2-20121128/3740_1 /TAXON_ID=420556 /ORGANISM="Ochromonas sp., Strain CCMP1393" /LENGTH=276 /DNA_ID=CAMNT_0016208883 /DNA_START=43 /DNA_END=873 /DNA_ORIENTATION=-